MKIFKMILIVLFMFIGQSALAEDLLNNIQGTWKVKNNYCDDGRSASIKCPHNPSFVEDYIFSIVQEGNKITFISFENKQMFGTYNNGKLKADSGYAHIMRNFTEEDKPFLSLFGQTHLTGYLSKRDKSLFVRGKFPKGEKKYNFKFTLEFLGNYILGDTECDMLKNKMKGIFDTYPRRSVKKPVELVLGSNAIALAYHTRTTSSYDRTQWKLSGSYILYADGTKGDLPYKKYSTMQGNNKSRTVKKRLANDIAYYYQNIYSGEIAEYDENKKIWKRDHEKRRLTRDKVDGYFKKLSALECSHTSLLEKWHNLLVRNGERNVQGEETYSDGSKYVGGFKDGKRHGQGTYTWASGNKYVGEFRDGKRTGQGTFTWTSGSKYVGGFKDGKRHGHGIYTYPSGNVKVGIWREGKFMSK